MPRLAFLNEESSLEKRSAVYVAAVCRGHLTRRSTPSLAMAHRAERGSFGCTGLRLAEVASATQAGRYSADFSDSFCTKSCVAGFFALQLSMRNGCVFGRCGLKMTSFDTKTKHEAVTTARLRRGAAAGRKIL